MSRFLRFAMSRRAVTSSAGEMRDRLPSVAQQRGVRINCRRFMGATLSDRVFMPGQNERKRLLSSRQHPYDAGMTRSKIAISLPRNQLARVQQEVRAGRADSVSGYISRVLAEQERRESLRVLLRDLVKQHGAPATEDMKWAERVLAPRRG